MCYHAIFGSRDGAIGFRPATWMRSDATFMSWYGSLPRPDGIIIHPHPSFMGVKVRPMDWYATSMGSHANFSNAPLPS
jgi:hypothetical protein